ncbi:response regulator [Gemmatimonas groenlandica]|uniref:histidine kinase n=1 Tax=Gemmatimonas groenlandica TaxID=2732249 RepID=A0A6M4IT18_9BACT|nr:response regulator [Gemmatimonas groenlandica]QJR37355.1 response regulator [Gemmatimonas groenlandica]
MTARVAAPGKSAVVILLVEDSPSDRLITKAALEEARLLNTLHTVANGVEALAFLRREGSYADAPRPDLILLDLNLPRMDGREVLVHIKADPSLRHIPVVVLTTSAAPEDVAAAYAAHANSYITKPVDFRRFHEALASLERYWFEVVTLPPHAAPSGSPSAVPAEIGRSAAGRVAVLLVEDSPSDALLVRSSLAAKSTAFELVHVTRLSDAAPLLAERRFDVIVTDLSLPDAQALEAVHALRRLSTHGEPIIVLTGNADGRSGEEALRSGAEDYLQKNELGGSGLGRAILFAIQRREARDERHQRQRVDAVGRLAAGVAHDFNNLLTAMAVSAEMVLTGSDPMERTELLQEILATADRGRALTRHLLTFSRRDRFEAHPMSVNGVIVAIARLLERLIVVDVAVELELAADLPLVLSDEQHLEQVVLNLAMNASDAMPGGGKLTMATTRQAVDVAAAAAISAAMRPGEYVRISVRDTGSGIPDDVRARMFEPFFTTKAEGRGTGLGLATVHEIVQLHGGAIGVTARDGGGTVFDVYLPACDMPPKREVRASVRAESKPGSGTILLVDDEASLRSVMQRVLSRNGYTVLVADCAEAAWHIWDAQRDAIDLVITDLIMPGSFTARDLAARLAVERPALPVIFCSGYSDSFDDPTLALSKGANFIAKPYSIETLLNTVSGALARQAQAW